MLSFSSESMARPLLHVEDPAELDTFEWPSGDVFDYSVMEAILEQQKHRVLWAQAGTWSPIFCKICDLCGMEKVMFDLIENPDLIAAITERIIAFYKETFRRTLEASRGRLDVFGFGDDLATQQGLMFSLEAWRRFFKEPMRELIRLIKSYDVYVAFHSCGAIRPLIPEFIEMGVDILFPIQPRAAGMEPEGLKKDFANDVVFYGGIDVQRILPFGTEEEVRGEVKRVSTILSKDGGYILASAHGILKDVPPANVLAMYDEINKLKKPRGQRGNQG
jgi:uroporphyrinogen decarboxylase